MTKTRAFFITAIGVVTAGLVAAAPAAAGSLTVAKPAVVADQTPHLQLATDRRGWVEGRTRWKHDEYDRRGSDRRGHDRDYGRYYDDDDRRHFKRKKRKFFKRGFRRGYDEGYDQGRYDSRFERRHRRRHHHHDNYGFRGGFSFGGPGFRFRY